MDATTIFSIIFIIIFVVGLYYCCKACCKRSNSGGAPSRSPIEIPPLRRTPTASQPRKKIDHRKPEVDKEPQEDDYDRGHHSDSSEERRRGRAKNKKVCEQSDYHNQYDIDDRGGDGGGDGGGD